MKIDEATDRMLENMSTDATMPKTKTRLLTSEDSWGNTHLGAKKWFHVSVTFTAQQLEANGSVRAWP